MQVSNRAGSTVRQATAGVVAQCEGIDEWFEVFQLSGLFCRGWDFLSHFSADTGFRQD